MSDIRVEAASASYTVHVDRNLLASLAQTTAGLAKKISQVFIITSPEIDRLWGQPVRSGFEALGKPVTTLAIPAGEQHKRMATIERLLEELAQNGADRDTLLVALGGGVLGDMTGFLAAIWMRGVPFIQVPTTLLSQVDSSVGGKTGANLAAGKNLVGAFYHPLAVFADLDTLSTLPPRELRAGLQESVKAGVIRDADLFAFMEKHAASIRKILDIKERDGELDEELNDELIGLLQPIVEASIRMKANVVEEDERESGLRMILNFGHTVGHAIEAATNYKQLLHGEAIGWGMIAAIRLAQSRNALDEVTATRIVNLVNAFGPLPPFEAEAQRLVTLTGSDKKKRSGTLSFILPTSIGSVDIVQNVTEVELLSAVGKMKNEVMLNAVTA